MSTHHVVIVGGGLAGTHAALELRRLNFTGRVTILGEERERPYDRPPLSKEVLLGKGVPDSIYLLAPETARAQSIDIVTGARVARIDREANTVQLIGGERLPYDTLILATGGAARGLNTLPADNAQVFALRGMDDAALLAQALARTPRTLIVGGGWLGLEIASAARMLGADVTLVEAAPRLCQRSVPPQVSHYLHELHHANGVAILHGNISLSRRETIIELTHDSGERMAFDVAVIAIGMTPRDELARNAGLACDNGVLTDESGRTEDPRIFAVGDVAAAWSDALRRHCRMESWQNAIAQGRRAARAILGADLGQHEAPWFWSEQAGRLIQVAGLPDADHALLSFEDGPKPLWRYGRGDTVHAVIGVDRARDVRQAHRALSAQWQAAAPQSTRVA